MCFRPKESVFLEKHYGCFWKSEVKGENCLDSVHISYNWSFEYFHVSVYRLWINLGARGGAFSSGGKIHSNPPKSSVCVHSGVVCSTWQQHSLHFSYSAQAADEGWAKFTLFPPSAQMLILPVNGCTSTEMKDTWTPPHLCKHLATNADWKGKEGPNMNTKGPGQAVQLYLLEVAEMQQVVVNRGLQGEGQGEGQQKKGGDLLLGRAAKELCRNVGENTVI